MSTEVEANLSKEQPEIHSLLLAEYSTLREEILKRVELRSQVMSLTLIVFGTILSFGLQAHSSSVILLYPILTIFLAANWTHNGIRIKEISVFIRDRIESRIGENTMTWEHRAKPNLKSLDKLNFLSAIGIFIGTSLFTVLVALPLATFNTIEIILFIFAIISVICSIIILRLFSQVRFHDKGMSLHSS